MKKIIKDIVIKLIGLLTLWNGLLYTYLLFLHYANVPCSVNWDWCDIVNKSSYSELFWIPVALLWIIWMFIQFAISLFLIFYAKKQSGILLKILMGMSVFGMWFWIYLIFVQAFILKSWCIYCLISDVILFIIMVLSIVLNLLEKH